MDQLYIHNTLSREKELFAPLDPGHVRMYVCGPTVYDRAHLGNARPVIVFDVLYRVLKRLFPKVTYARNITDVDDKINQRAKDSGQEIGDITRETTRMFHEDMGELGALPPDIEPRATAHISQMIDMIETLIKKGHAYAAQGHVLFKVQSMPEYGRLSKRSQDEMLAGARVEVAPYKQYAGDFVLWKPSDADVPGWPSPWGRGRPGWHIECSAMSREYLGESFDIHGGGLDLIFPHHENEIAQSTCCSGKPFVKYWMHNGFLKVEGEKMSKSLGNFFTVRELLEEAPGEAIRFAMLSTHYHQPLDWTAEGLKQAKQALDRFYLALESAGDAEASEPLPEFWAALLDDLNTPLAISLLHDLATKINKAGSLAEKAELKGVMLACGQLLGLLQQAPALWLKGKGDDDAEIEALVQERVAAKKAKDFAKADAIRAELTAKGIAIEDGPQGSKWRRL